MPIAIRRIFGVDNGVPYCGEPPYECPKRTRVSSTAGKVEMLGFKNVKYISPISEGEGYMPRTALLNVQFLFLPEKAN